MGEGELELITPLPSLGEGLGVREWDPPPCSLLPYLFFNFRQASDERMPTNTRTKSSKPSGTR
jgi:hypothetical protein